MLLHTNTRVLRQEQESGGGDRDCTQPTLLEIPTHRYDLRHQPKGSLPWPGKISPAISSSAGSKGSRLSPAPSLTCPRLWIHLSGAPSSSPTGGTGSSLVRRSVALRVPTVDTAGLGRPTAADRPRPVLGARVAALRSAPQAGTHPAAQPLRERPG